MRSYKFNDTVLSVKGNADSFLNGLTSNTLDAPLNAFLNQHGRIIATFRQKKVSGDEFLIAVPVVAVDNLLKHLERYAKLSHARIDRSDQKIFLDLDGVRTFWDNMPHVNSISEEEFTLFRLDHRLPLMGVDYKADEFILNVHEFDFVSYAKGCFLGQEPVAKVHNRAAPVRRLIVAFEDVFPPEQAAKMTSLVKDPISDRTKGFIFIHSSLPLR